MANDNGRHGRNTHTCLGHQAGAENRGHFQRFIRCARPFDIQGFTMGYLPPGDDVRRLHALETRLIPLVRQLVALYPDVSSPIPLAPCQEVVARWFGHPNWHAAAKQAQTQNARGQKHFQDVSAPSVADAADSAWMRNTPIQTLRGFARKTHAFFNGHSEKRPPPEEWDGSGDAALMAHIFGFQTSLEMNQAWMERHAAQKPRRSLWARAVSLLRPTPPTGPWTWARQESELLDARAADGHRQGVSGAKTARNLGQDLDSGWWMGMTDAQTRTHALLLGAADSGRDEVLSSWVWDSVQRGQGVLWMCGRPNEEARDFERVLDEQARQSLRPQDRFTLDFTTSSAETSEIINTHTIDCFEGLSSGGLTEALIHALPAMENGGGRAHTRGRAIGLISAIAMALVHDQAFFAQTNTPRPISFEKLHEALEFEGIERLAARTDFPPHILIALSTYFGGLRTEATARDTAAALHQMVAQPVLGALAQLREFSHVIGGDSSRTRGEAPWAKAFLSASLMFVRFGDFERTHPAAFRFFTVLCRLPFTEVMGQALNQGEDSLRRPPPNTVVYDHCLCDGLASSVLPAQARSLGISMIHCDDSLFSMQERVSSEGLDALLANTLTQAFMRGQNTQGLEAHWARLAGQIESFARGSAAERPARPEADLLPHYAVGEATVFHGRQWWRARMSHSAPSVS